MEKTIEKIIDLVSPLKKENNSDSGSDSDDSDYTDSYDSSNELVDDVKLLFKKYKLVCKRLNYLESRIGLLEEEQPGNSCTITTTKKRRII